MPENECAHCGSNVDAILEYKADPKEGIPTFRLCKPCARLLSERLVQQVEPYLVTGYGGVAHTMRVAIVKNFINQK